MRPINVPAGRCSYQRVDDYRKTPERLSFLHGRRLYIGKAIKLTPEGDHNYESLAVSGWALLGNPILDVYYKDDRDAELARVSEMIRQVMDRSVCGGLGPTNGYDNVAACKAFRRGALKLRRRQSIWADLFSNFSLGLPTLPSWGPSSSSSKPTFNVPRNFTPWPAMVCVLHLMQHLVFKFLETDVR